MSYMQFQQRCKACQKSWNAAFGIVPLDRFMEAIIIRDTRWLGQERRKAERRKGEL
jgi:hypothetical protein